MKTISFTFLAILFTLHASAGDIELGKVAWMRDLKEAQIASKKFHKPIFILFQEVPGCSTCKNYGSQVLSHPLIVESIETYFIPLCIYNNHRGKDAEALKYFSEPSWNNPVVRIVDSALKPLVDRITGNYTAYGLITKVQASLSALGIRIPEYLNLLQEELKAHQSGLESVTFGMYCFWTGEKTFGKSKGVISTNAGYMNGSEVVEIQYNPKEINLNELIQIGNSTHSADRMFTNSSSVVNINMPIQKLGTFRVDPETKYYLYQSDYKYVPMTALQATRANSFLSEGKSCDSILSPRQINRYQQIKSTSKSKLKNQIGRDISLAWYE